MELQLPTGRTKVVTVDIPVGVERGQQIRYRGMGEQNNPNLPPGDLIITTRVRKHSIFDRYGDNIVCEIPINVLELITGTKTKIQTLDRKSIEINIPKGTQPDTVLSCRGEGLPNMRTKQRGNLQIRIKGKIPTLNTEQLNRIKDIKDGI